jgi:hypothetical protein
MKQCSQCNRSYDDETVTFCLDDGTRLTTSYDPQATLILPQARVTEQSPVVAPPTQLNQPQIVRQGVRPSIVYGLVALLALVIGGGAVALFYERGKGTATGDGNKQTELPSSSPMPAREDAGNKDQPGDNAIPERTPRREDAGSAVPGKYPEGSSRLLTPEDVSGKSPWELKVMKNEIYARHGYIFKSSELRSYFESQPWYRPTSDDVSAMMSNIEKENAAFIKGYE